VSRPSRNRPEIAAPDRFLRQPPLTQHLNRVNESFKLFGWVELNREPVSSFLIEEFPRQAGLAVQQTAIHIPAQNGSALTNTDEQGHFRLSPINFGSIGLLFGPRGIRLGSSHSLFRSSGMTFGSSGLPFSSRGMPLWSSGSLCAPCLLNELFELRKLHQWAK
jgi:hypothetical protein